jgi:hypothetical protein
LGFLNEDFGINISKEKVEVNLFGDVTINGLKIKDFKNNDMIVAKELRADSDWFSIIQSMVFDKKINWILILLLWRMLCKCGDLQRRFYR